MIRINFDTEDIIRNFEAANDQALTEFAEEVLADSNNFCPLAEGPLKRSAIIAAEASNQRKISWNTPYAAYLYYGVLMVAPNGSAWAKQGETKHVKSPEVKLDFSKDNPNAQDMWFHKAKDVNIDKWVTTYKNALERERR